jgi:predicted Zn-dependent protease
MEEKTKYIKKQDLVGVAFTIKKVWPAQWTMWDNVARTMSKSDVPKKDHSKTYNVVTSEGTVGISAHMLGNFLEAVQSNGQSSIIGATFRLATNGKTGMEVRYFINVVDDVEDRNDDSAKSETRLDDDTEQEINLDSIPF